MKNESKKRLQFHKRFIAAAVLLTFLLFSSVSTAWMSESCIVRAEEGGSEEAPIPIDTVEELKAIANGLDKNYILTKDIELDVASYWKPIGTAEQPFTGSLDGNGYKISNLTIVAPISHLGLFSHISNAEIKNLKMENVNIQGESYIAALAAHAAGASEIENCFVSGFVKGANYIGGLIGHYSGTGSIKNAAMSGEINATSYAGGLIGYYSGTGIENSVMTGKVNVTSQYVGSMNSKSTKTIVGCSNSGSVQGVASVGGIIGNHTGSKLETISVRNKGKVVGSLYNVGGLVGRSENHCLIKEFENIGDVSADGFIGGVIGNQYEGYVLDLISVNNIGKIARKTSYVGGLIGYSRSQCSIKESANFGNTSGGTYVGGIVGLQTGKSLEISSISNKGTVSGSADYVGGLIGSSSGQSLINESANLGAINGKNSVGGLAGNINTSAKIDILNSYNRGNVIGTGDNNGGNCWLPADTSRKRNSELLFNR